MPAILHPVSGDGAGPDPGADRKGRASQAVACRRSAAAKCRFHPRGIKTARGQIIRRRTGAAPGSDFRGAGDAMFDQKVGKAGKPFFVIAESGVIHWRQAFTHVTGGIDVPFAKRAGRHREGQCPPMPVC